MSDKCIHTYVTVLKASQVDPISEVLQHCTQVAKQYKITPSYHRRFERLVRRARTCVPSTIHTLQEVPINTAPRKARALHAQLIQAWKDYALAVDISQSGSAYGTLPTSTFRTCGLRTCLCHGKKPAHSLRACAGCWEVFYCGSKCQTEYAHREWPSSYS